MLEEINGWLKTHGHTPQTDIVLHDLEDAQKERSLGVHSEKLALAFGLITTKPGTTIKIVKNLRVCADCHAVTKLISKITGRKIVMRDRNRFHHFVNGSCSCGDYWPSSRRFNVLEYFHIGKCCITYISLSYRDVVLVDLRIGNGSKDAIPQQLGIHISLGSSTALLRFSGFVFHSVCQWIHVPVSFMIDRKKPQLFPLLNAWVLVCPPDFLQFWAGYETKTDPMQTILYIIVPETCQQRPS
ncbi:hypothetical protein OIU78_028691 [Salix suchowensis]|nr:hypothetical protein OIU78_028691 [Salix suchowensis]